MTRAEIDRRIAADLAAEPYLDPVALYAHYLDAASPVPVEWTWEDRGEDFTPERETEGVL